MASIAITGTGGIVRVTGSGLGCDGARPDDATLYLPFNLYAPQQQEMHGRRRRRLAPALLARVERLVNDHAAAEGRANPFHWAAAKLVHGGGALTLYTSAAAVEAARTPRHPARPHSGPLPLTT
ncbi:hypothetical protein [Streptomyces sp. NPDC004050]